MEAQVLQFTHIGGHASLNQKCCLRPSAFRRCLLLHRNGITGNDLLRHRRPQICSRMLRWVGAWISGRGDVWPWCNTRHMA